MCKCDNVFKKQIRYIAVYNNNDNNNKQLDIPNWAWDFSKIMTMKLRRKCVCMYICM